MDYGKFKYESAQKAREARRNQALTVIKEMRLRLKIDPHDYETKKGHVERFLKGGDKVKITVMFRGREQSRPEMGYRLLQRLAADVADLGRRRVQPEAGRPEHGHGDRSAPEPGSHRRRPTHREGGEGTLDEPARSRRPAPDEARRPPTDARSRRGTCRRADDAGQTRTGRGHAEAEDPQGHRASACA